jgi:hypothetical protein
LSYGTIIQPVKVGKDKGIEVVAGNLSVTSKSSSISDVDITEVYGKHKYFL